MTPSGTESVQVPGIAPDWSPELLDLNQRLLEEISNVQLRMVEVLRENFQLKTDLEIAREALYVAECNSQRKHKYPIPTVQRKKSSSVRYMHGYEHGGAKPYLTLPITADDLKRSVDDMIHLVGDLNSKALPDDPRDNMNSSPSNRALPPPSYLEKGGGWWPGSHGPTVDDIAQTEEILSRKLSLTLPDGGPFNLLADYSPRPVPPPVVNAPSRSSGSGSKRETPGAIFKLDNNKDEERFAPAPNNVMSSVMSHAEQAVSQQELFRQLTLLQSIPGKTWLSNESLSLVSAHRTGANDGDFQEDAASSAPKSVPEER